MWKKVREAERESRRADFAHSFRDVSIKTEGLMNGDWQIKISDIKDKDLHDIEVKVLKIFGRKKRS